MLQCEDLSGKKFGRLTAIQRMKDNNPKHKKTVIYWLCECECGQQTVVQANNLKTKNTQSCGCLGIELAAKKAKNRINKIMAQREEAQKKWGIGG